MNIRYRIVFLLSGLLILSSTLFSFSVPGSNEAHADNSIAASVGNQEIPRPIATPQGAVPESVKGTDAPNYGCGNFSDVISSDYFYEGVVFMNCRNIVGGYTDGTFRPYNYITRGQLAKIATLSHYFNTDYTGSPHFADVPTTDTFYKYIETAYAAGMMTAHYCNPSCYFEGWANATRAEASRAMIWASQQYVIAPATASFTDVAVGSAYYGYIETAVARGLVTGYSCGTNCAEFKPNDPLYRGQLVKMDTNNRFFHADDPDIFGTDGPYEGSNNWDIASGGSGGYPALRTIPSGDLIASSLGHSKIRARAQKILYTNAAKQWLINNAGTVQGNGDYQYQPGLEFSARAGVGYCAYGSWSSYSTNLPGATLDSYQSCTLAWHVHNAPLYPFTQLSTDLAIYWATGDWTSTSQSVFTFHLRNTQYNAPIQAWSQLDFMGVFCFDKDNGVLKC